jgi:hypothetical protein
MKMLTVPVRMISLCTLAVREAVPAWFRWLGTLRPGARIGFDELGAGDRYPLWLAAPSPPSRNVARTLTPGTARHLFAELARAARLAGNLDRIAVDLAHEPPPGETLVITGTTAALGRYSSRFRGLLDELDARPWGIDRGGAHWHHRLTVGDATAALATVAAWLDRTFEVDRRHAALTPARPGIPCRHDQGPDRGVRRRPRRAGGRRPD